MGGDLCGHSLEYMEKYFCDKELAVILSPGEYSGYVHVLKINNVTMLEHAR